LGALDTENNSARSPLPAAPGSGGSAANEAQGGLREDNLPSQKANKKRILVICGSGVATSGVSALRIRKLLEKWGIRNVDVDVASFGFARREAELSDVLVDVIPTRPIPWPCPSISGLPFMMGKGMEEQLKEILKIIGVPIPGSAK